MRSRGKGREGERRGGERGMMRLVVREGGWRRRERPMLICRILREVYTTPLASIRLSRSLRIPWSARLSSWYLLLYFILFLCLATSLSPTTCPHFCLPLPARRSAREALLRVVLARCFFIVVFFFFFIVILLSARSNGRREFWNFIVAFPTPRARRTSPDGE